MTVARFRLTLDAAGLVASPLLFAAYWILFPAYGDLHASDFLADISGAPDRALVADGFAFTAVFLAVPGVLAYLRALDGRAPRLAASGGALSVLGWLAVLPTLTMDLAARELGAEPAAFTDLFTSPGITTLNALAGLHIVGAVLIGIALVRTRLVPRGLAIAATLAPVVHLAANLSSLLWVDVATWLVVAATGVAVLAELHAQQAPARRRPALAGARSL